MSKAFTTMPDPDDYGADKIHEAVVDMFVGDYTNDAILHKLVDYICSVRDAAFLIGAASVIDKDSDLIKSVEFLMNAPTGRPN